MSEYTANPAPGPAGDPDRTDLRKHFTPEQLAELEQSMARAAGTTTPLPAPAAPAVEDSVYEAEYVDDDQAEDLPGWLPAEKRQIIPGWARGAEQIKHTAGHAGAIALNRAGFHAFRSPIYFARFAKVCGIGVCWSAATCWDYLSAGELGEMVDIARRQKVGEEHVLALRAERKAVIKTRVKSTATTVGLSAAGLWVWGWPWLAEHASTGTIGLGGGVLAALLFQALGRRELRRRDGAVFQVVDQAAAEVTGPISDTRLIAALTTAGLLKDGVQAVPVGPVQPVGDGALVHIYDLTGGLTADKVAAKTKEIAGALRLPADQVDISRGEHESQIVIWTATKNPFKDGRPSPLFGKGGRAKPVDVWDTGVPVGFDHRGRTVYLRLRHVMALLGGMSQTGKGMLLRNIIPAVALDVAWNLRLVSGRKAAELATFAPVCATFFGNREERLLALLKAFKSEADRRDDYLEEHGIRRITKDMLDRFPMELLVIDEAQAYTDNPEIVRLLEQISGYAASLNMTVLLVTQDPDAKTIPPKYKKNTKSRIATKTATAAQTNAILNDGATGNGMAAHHIPVSTPGLAIIDADGQPGVLFRGFFIEDREYDGVLPLVEDAVELRRQAGRLPGQFDDPIENALIAEFGTSSAAGGPKGMGRPGAVVRGILADLLRVFEDRGMPERITTAELLAGLAQARIDVWSPAALGLGPGFGEADYNRAGGTRLAKAIAEALDATPRKLGSRQWKADGRNVTGFYLADVRTAAGLS